MDKGNVSQARTDNSQEHIDHGGGFVKRTYNAAYMVAVALMWTLCAGLLLLACLRMVGEGVRDAAFVQAHFILDNDWATLNEALLNGGTYETPQGVRVSLIPEASEDQETDGVQTLDGEHYIYSLGPAPEALYGTVSPSGGLRGDVPLSLAVYVPLAPYAASAARTNVYLAVAHVVLWLMGLGFIAYMGSYQAKWVAERNASGKYVLEMSQEFETRVEARTRDLTAAKDAAEQASRAKGEFLSNMSHEIRTPINAIVGMTLIGEKAAETERKDYAFNKIAVASNHLLGIINDVLDMAKIEANKLELVSKEFNFEKALQRVVNFISYRVDERDQAFNVNIDKDMPAFVEGDDQRFAQVVTNLLSNAVKFTPENGLITLDAKLLREDNGVCEIEVLVTDSGIGLSPEQQERLFTSFQQAESGISRRFGGTGLGLAISKRIVELMGGKIWVTSELGQGAVFGFTMKARRGRQDSPERYGGANWKGLRIMAVDDDPAVREYFIDYADYRGLHCDVASDGEAALELIDRYGTYGIYFVDWKMPGMNGLELSRRIKAKDPGNAIIIMISSARWDEIQPEAKEADITRFLPKPLFPSAITDLITECLAGSGVMPKDDVEAEDIPSFPGKRILLAEDVEINRVIVLSLLEPTGLVIDCAENGREALNMAEEGLEDYDMVFMDIHMPEMDGLEATRLIRALGTEAAAKVPIIAMTANVFREDIERCLEAGMNGHVGKPLDLNEVIAVLKEYL